MIQIQLYGLLQIMVNQYWVDFFEQLTREERKYFEVVSGGWQDGLPNVY